MKILQKVVGTGSPPLSGHMFNREAAGTQKRPDRLEDVTEWLVAIEPTREVVTRSILKPSSSSEKSEKTKAFLIMRQAKPKT